MRFSKYSCLPDFNVGSPSDKAIFSSSRMLLFLVSICLPKPVSYEA